MKLFKVERFTEPVEMIPDDGLWKDSLRVHPSRDARPWWQRLKLSPWSGIEKVKGKKESYKGIKGNLDL
jgi:hypothetical protein